MTKLQPSSPWWQQGVIYQIYPKSFQDSNGDGIGDLQGIIQRLDYLHQLGVDALWLTPIYLSPQVDNGYDVSGYCAIDSTYGTMADFEQLVEAAHQRGMRIIMDMVFNHTSTQHPWFQMAAEDRKSLYRPFYIWRDGKAGQPPNHWRSKFGGSAWQWHPESEQYYLHLFSPEQADLNWEHPYVREALKAVCRFWAGKGVDGLRLDVINLVSKQQDFIDDPHGDGRCFYTDGPRIHEFLQEFSREVFQPCGLMTVGEMSSTSLAHCRQYANLTGSELSMTFNFHHLKVDYANGEKWTLAAADFVALKALFCEWQQGMYQQAWNALFWCNHDQPRIVSRFGHEGEWREVSAKMLAMVLHGMQGTPYIYQGEELGMLNPHFTSIDQYRDVESHNYYQHGLEKGLSEAHLLAVLASKSRDNSRTPMAWSSDKHGGFTEGTPWISTPDHFQAINAQSALVDRDSVFYTYQQLIALRKRYSVVTQGDYRDLAPEHSSLWCYQRCWQTEHLLVVANLGQDELVWQAEGIANDPGWQCLLSNYPDAPAHPCAGVLRPYEAVWWWRGELD